MFVIGRETYDNERIARMVDVVNGYLVEMRHAPIVGPFEHALCERLMKEQLTDAWKCGHLVWDGYDVADEVRDHRQRTVQVGHA